VRFESPGLLLLIVPVVAAAWWSFARLRSSPPCLRFPSLDRVLAARPPLRGRLWWLPRAISALGAVVAVVALARPQVESDEELQGEGIDFVIALDMSGSMKAVDRTADDILALHAKGREPSNRFEAARDVIKAFVRSREHDRIGLVVFASQAYVKFPLTLDKDAMIRILDGLVLDDGVRGADGTCVNGCTIPGESTAIGDALGRAYKRVEDSETKSRNILLITDGENNAGKAAPDEVARFIGEQSKERPVRVFPFLVGSGDETYVPAVNPFTGRPQTNAQGRRMYERSREQPVNPGLLKEISRLSGGSFFAAETEEDFRKAFEGLELTEFSAPAMRRWREAFLPPLALALALVLLGEVLGWTLFRRWP